MHNVTVTVFLIRLYNLVYFHQWLSTFHVTCPVLGDIRYASASRTQPYSEASLCLPRGNSTAIQGRGQVRHCSGRDQQQQMLGAGKI